MADGKKTERKLVDPGEGPSVLELRQAHQELCDGIVGLIQGFELKFGVSVRAVRIGRNPIGSRGRTLVNAAEVDVEI